MPVDTPLLIPSIPSDAPFSADQKVWLAGFLAGLHTRLLADPGPVRARVARRPACR